MNAKELKDYPSLVNADIVEAVCKPLVKDLGIDYFCHVNVYAKGYFTSLGKNPRFIEHYLNAGYYNCDVHLSDSHVNEEYVLQDTVIHHGTTRQLFEDCHAFGLHHLFTILQRNKDSVDAFHFACTEQTPGINEWYLSNVPSLKKFIRHFKSTVLTDPFLSKAYQYQLVIDFSATGYQTEAKHQANQKKLCDQIEQASHSRIYLPGSQTSYLTSRELQCLLWLHHGKTYDEIAVILHVTERTVRAHINSAKEKFNCISLFQLGEKLAELELLDS